MVETGRVVDERLMANDGINSLRYVFHCRNWFVVHPVPVALLLVRLLNQ